MKVRQKIGRGLKSLIDFPRWMGWKQIKGSTKELTHLAKWVMSPQTAKHKETFEEAARRLKLSDEAIKKQASRHLLLALVIASLVAALLIYSIYLLMSGHYEGFILGIFVSALSASLAFREHFYYFQMKKRHLGFTFKDWLNFVLGRGKK